MEFRKNWWKYIGILLMLYVITAGLLVPLRQGILEVTPARLHTSSTYDLDITGYNTHFSNKKYEAYIKLDNSHVIKAVSTSISTDQQMSVKFAIPDVLVNSATMQAATLVLIDDDNEYSIYPSLSIIQSNVKNGHLTSKWGDVLSISRRKWTFSFPYRNILLETIRNTFFHVAIWMAMFILLTISLVNSVLYLRNGQFKYDHWASSFTYVSVVFGIIGVVTGAIWAKFTWGAYWTNDVKLNMVAISMMIYLAYGILRSSIDDIDKRAKSAAIYNIFAFCAMIPLVMIIPRLTASLHPGNGGNPALGGEDLDSTLRLVFYPAIIGFALIGGWMAQLWYRVRVIEENQINKQLRQIN